MPFCFACDCWAFAGGTHPGGADRDELLSGASAPLVPLGAAGDAGAVVPDALEPALGVFAWAVLAAAALVVCFCADVSFVASLV